jgi:predicted ATPase
MFFFFNNVPQELQSNNRSENDVSILIGANGSGKSQMLGQLTRIYLGQQRKVIAISNSIYDKFPNSGRNLHLLRDRAGRYKAKRSIKNALLNISPRDTVRFKNVSEALRFVGYDPVIGIERVDISASDIDDAIARQGNYEIPYDENDFQNRRFHLDENPINELKSLLFKSGTFDKEPIIWLTLNEFSFSEIDRISFIQLLKYETLLKKLNLSTGINLFLRKNANEIPLYSASSGELSFISSVVYLATTIDENSVVLIDEPENSLHPSWQKDYIKILIELFYLYQPKIIAATHSALIVTGAEVANQATTVFECSNFQFVRKIREPINIEEAFYDYFHVITPENRFLSDLLVSRLNDFAENQVPYDALMRELDLLKRNSYEPKQLEVLDGIKAMATKIYESKLANNE